MDVTITFHYLLFYLKCNFLFIAIVQLILYLLLNPYLSTEVCGGFTSTSQDIVTRIKATNLSNTVSSQSECPYHGMQIYSEKDSHALDCLGFWCVTKEWFQRKSAWIRDIWIVCDLGHSTHVICCGWSYFSQSNISSSFTKYV